MNTLKYKAVIFDLDGTLVDTAPDLAAALNYLLITHNKAPLDFDDIRHVASDGSLGLIKLGFGIHEKDPRYPILRKEFLHYYLNHIADRSVLFEGMDEILHFSIHLRSRAGCGVHRVGSDRRPAPVIARRDTRG